MRKYLELRVKKMQVISSLESKYLVISIQSINIYKSVIIESVTLALLKSLFIISIIGFMFIDGHFNLCYAKNIEIANSNFTTVFDSSTGGIISLKRSKDVFDTEYIKKDHMLGDVMIRLRALEPTLEPDWQVVKLSEKNINFRVEIISKNEFQIVYSIKNDRGLIIKLIKHFLLEEDALVWTMRFQNYTDKKIEIGDLALPLRMNTDFIGGDLMDEKAVQLTYQNRLNEHRLINGHGSFIFWMRANGIGPYLLMVPKAGTKLEYFNSNYSAFINSAFTGGNENRGTWRQKHTSTILEPRGNINDSIIYGFKFVWGDDYEGVRNALYQNGGFDIHVVPGMTLPTNLTAKFSLRTKNNIQSVVPEHPEHTVIECLGKKDNDIHIYSAKFSKLGENLITINYNDDSSLILEFFITEPLEILYKKRANFIVENQQHRNDKWYNGLFSLWDMKEKILRSPEDTGGLPDYMVGGSDDPSNSKCVYLAEKNVVLPNAKEIEALEYFIEKFVWGKLQRTDKEYPHPYGIYGSENWYLNRNTEWGTTNEKRIRRLEKQLVVPQGTGLGAERMWRTFDYTTYIMLYYNMYRIAKLYPNMVNYLDAAGYLNRAFGTSKAFFQVPYSIYMLGKPLWSFQGFSDWAYKLGNFHEKYIVEVITALKKEGMIKKGNWLKNEWEKKVKYFIYDNPLPFGSEFVFDRTAFESTHVIARYAIQNPMQSDTNLWYDKNKKIWYSHPEIKPEDAFDFLERQIEANIAMRGWLETSYYYLGSARVGGNTLDYMSQMAGWSILDYALYFSNEPAKYVRLGYASILSSWALVNSGTPESNYGYWYPGKENDGAAGWNFQTEKYGKTWNFGYTSRGPWYYDGEIDHGLAGGILAAATILMDDPIFGKIAYGGELTKDIDHYYIIPKDGVRRRFHFIDNKKLFHLLLNTDGFLKGKPIIIKNDLTEIKIKIENRSHRPHLLRFSLLGLPIGKYNILLNENIVSTFEIKNNEQKYCQYPIGGDDEYRLKIKYASD